MTYGESSQGDHRLGKLSEPGERDANVAVIPVSFGQANLKFTGAGYPTGAEITIGFDPLAISAAAAADAFVDLWDTHLKGDTPSAVTLSSVLVKYGPNDTGASAEVGAGIAGTGTDGQVQPGVCALIQKRTADGGRRNRGRIYYPIGEASILDGGALATAYVTGSQSDWALFLAAMPGNTGPMVVLHNDAGFTPTEVTSLSVQARAATQRRRLRR
jgi:hypothetical protein